MLHCSGIPGISFTHQVAASLRHRSIPPSQPLCSQSIPAGGSAGWPLIGLCHGQWYGVSWWEDRRERGGRAVAAGPARSPRLISRTLSTLSRTWAQSSLPHAVTRAPRPLRHPQRPLWVARPAVRGRVGGDMGKIKGQCQQHTAGRARGQAHCSLKSRGIPLSSLSPGARPILCSKTWLPALLGCRAPCL